MLAHNFWRQIYFKRIDCLGKIIHAQLGLEKLEFSVRKSLHTHKQIEVIEGYDSSIGGGFGQTCEFTTIVEGKINKIRLGKL